MVHVNHRIGVDLKGKWLLVDGCGTGSFATRAFEREANVTSIEIAPKLVEISKRKNPSVNSINAQFYALTAEDLLRSFVGGSRTNKGVQFFRNKQYLVATPGNLDFTVILQAGVKEVVDQKG